MARVIAPAPEPLLVDIVDREISALAYSARVYARFNRTERDSTGFDRTELALNGIQLASIGIELAPNGTQLASNRLQLARSRAQKKTRTGLLPARVQS